MLWEVDKVFNFLPEKKTINVKYYLSLDFNYYSTLTVLTLDKSCKKDLLAFAKNTWKMIILGSSKQEFLKASATLEIRRLLILNLEMVKGRMGYEVINPVEITVLIFTYTIKANHGKPLGRAVGARRTF